MLKNPQKSASLPQKLKAKGLFSKKFWGDGVAQKEPEESRSEENFSKKNNFDFRI